MIEFVPYQGCGEIRFGMSQDQVVELLGPPKLSARNWLGAMEMFYPLYIVHLGHEHEVAEITFHPGACVLLDGVDIMSFSVGREYLLQRSKEKYAGAGSIVMVDLGVAMSDHERPESAEPITVFAKRRMDRLVGGYKNLP